MLPKCSEMQVRSRKCQFPTRGQLPSTQTSLRPHLLFFPLTQQSIQYLNDIIYSIQSLYSSYRAIFYAPLFAHGQFLSILISTHFLMSRGNQKLYQNVSIHFYYFLQTMTEEIVVNNTIGTIAEESGQNGGFFGLSYPVMTIIVCIILMFVAVKLSKSKKKPRNIIAILGERFAGKTQLFITLNEGKKIKTVPSIRNNKTTYRQGNKAFEMVDYIGDNISKEQVLQRINEVHTVIHVIDGTDEKMISDAAMFLYKVLVSKDYQKNNCNYLIFLNKNDDSAYVGKVKILQKLEDQIEHIKQSRINLGEENENEDDFIKLSKNRFKIPFPILEGSAESNVKDLQMTLDNL